MGQSSMPRPKFGLELHRGNCPIKPRLIMGPSSRALGITRSGLWHEEVVMDWKLRVTELDKAGQYFPSPTGLILYFRKLVLRSSPRPKAQGISKPENF